MVLKILVTNDDGVTSPGIWALAESLSRVGEVVVVAPDREQSGVGSSVTLHQPVRLTPKTTGCNGIEAYAVEGTPGDCVILATTLDPVDDVLEELVGVIPTRESLRAVTGKSSEVLVLDEQY